MATKAAMQRAKVSTNDIARPDLAGAGRLKIEWADAQMPVLAQIRARFRKERPFAGLRISACLHVTSETANLVRTLAEGGGSVCLVASNPLSTQDDTAAALVAHYGIQVQARRGEDRATYYRHLAAALARRPHLTLDDGADLVSLLHEKHRDQIPGIAASLEETTTGVIRLRAMAADGALALPVFAVNDADTKHLFDNRYGTGQSTVDGILRATNLLLAGRVFVVAGYGWCGRGLASRAAGMGARVVVTEVDPLRALEATMDGFDVMPMAEAVRKADVVCTVTGNTSILRAEHMRLLKDGAVIANSGHFNVEIDLPALKAQSRRIVRNVRPNLDAYHLKNGRTVYVVGEGRLANLAAAEGHPAAVMDMSFAVQALTAEHAVRHRGRLAARVHEVPAAIDRDVARLKLATLGVRIDRLTPEQKKYLSNWREGT